MKKVGIVTYHRHYNYGTMLQALALQDAVNKTGCRAEIIDFFQPNVLHGKERFFSYAKKTLEYAIHPGEFRMRIRRRGLEEEYREQISQKKKNFDDFYKNICLSEKKYDSSAELRNDPPEYDVYMTGSDQTWNPNVGGNPDAFYLDFAPADKRRACYAPSVSAASLTEDQKTRMSKLLNNIEILSCREKQGAELLEEITGRKVETVLDPVFLLSGEEWSEYAAGVSAPPQYILQYFLGKNAEHRKTVRKLSRELNIPVISIPGNIIDYDNADTENVWGGPGEFISLIRNAELVCTDSFHGTAFSLLFKRDVYTFLKHKQSSRKSENSRMEDLYRRFDITGRIVQDADSLRADKLTHIDYDQVQEKIDARISESEKYLRKALQI